eukprot:3940848-Rhodomonas_salina.2
MRAGGQEQLVHTPPAFEQSSGLGAHFTVGEEAPTHCEGTVEQTGVTVTEIVGWDPSEARWVFRFAFAVPANMTYLSKPGGGTRSVSAGHHTAQSWGFLQLSVCTSEIRDSTVRSSSVGS